MKLVSLWSTSCTDSSYADCFGWLMTTDFPLARVTGIAEAWVPSDLNCSGTNLSEPLAIDSFRMSIEVESRVEEQRRTKRRGRLRERKNLNFYISVMPLSLCNYIFIGTNSCLHPSQSVTNSGGTNSGCWVGRPSSHLGT